MWAGAAVEARKVDAEERKVEAGRRRGHYAEQICRLKEGSKILVRPLVDLKDSLVTDLFVRPVKLCSKSLIEEIRRRKRPSHAVPLIYSCI